MSRLPMPVAIARRAAAALTLAAFASLAACGSDAAGVTTPTTPTTPTTTGRADLSLKAQSYLSSALDVMQTYSLFTARVAWPSVRNRAQVRAAGAQTYVATYPAIDSALVDMGDVHSSFDRPGHTDFDSPDEPATTLNTPVASMVTSRVGYLFVPTFSNKGRMQRADTLQSLIRTLDTNNPCGWIVDLRRNPGGWTDAMLAGVAPLIGDGVLVNEVTPDSSRGGYVYQNGAISNVGIGGNISTFFTLARPYRIKNTAAPLAVLTDGLTASAGEWTLIALRGRAATTRTFGVATYGVPTGRYGFTMPDSAVIALTMSAAQDVRGRTYDAPIAPDEVVAGPTIPTRGAQDAVVTAALRWLNAQASCASGSVLADRAAMADAQPIAPLPFRARATALVGPDGRAPIDLRGLRPSELERISRP